MPHRRPPRLGCFDYCGFHRYFVTCCTAGRRAVFTSSDLIEQLAREILRTCDDRQFAILAYVFMPDHLHMLVEGRATDADFRSFMKVVRQRTALLFRRLTGEALWQDGYFERVLRSDEQTTTVIEYILGNPVRAGLVERVEDYPFSYAAGVHAELKFRATTENA